jgi:hypothetical protein
MHARPRQPQAKQIKRHINPNTGVECYYTPEGPFLHVPPPCPRTDYSTATNLIPWWQQQILCIGFLSQKVRSVRIINTLTRDESVLEVCGEEKLLAIQRRYTLAQNAHAAGYTWKRLGKILEMNMTLEENGIADEHEVFERLGMDADDYLPVLHLYFSDDLTVA